MPKKTSSKGILNNNNSHKPNCDICGNDKEPIFKECCGVKVCFPCDSIFSGDCSVCKRDKLNLEILCECCEKLGNYMTTHWCPYCEGVYCSDCLSIKEHPLIVCKKTTCQDKFWDDK